ncbi:unnamed protein product, partial [Bubo scandiacus]
TFREYQNMLLAPLLPVLFHLYENVHNWQYFHKLVDIGTVGFLDCKCTLAAHVQFFIHQYPQVLLHRAALSPFIPQPILIPGVALTHVQDFALGLVEPHEVHRGPPLELVQVPLDDIPSLRHVNSTTQLGVIFKLVEGALNPTVYVIDEDIEQYWSHSQGSPFYPFLKWGQCFPFSNHQGLHSLAAMTFQISRRVAWQLHQPIPSGLWDASHQVP